MFENIKILAPNSDIFAHVSEYELTEILEKMASRRSFSSRNTIKILITKNYDAVGLIATGANDVTLWEIGNLKSHIDNLEAL